MHRCMQNARISQSDCLISISPEQVAAAVMIRLFLCGSDYWYLCQIQATFSAMCRSQTQQRTRSSRKSINVNEVVEREREIERERDRQRETEREMHLMHAFCTHEWMRLHACLHDIDHAINWSRADACKNNLCMHASVHYAKCTHQLITARCIRCMQACTHFATVHA